MLEKKINAEHIGALICISLGGIAISESVRLYPVRMAGLVGDHVMPGFIGIAMILLGLSLFVLKGQEVKVVYPSRKNMLKILYTLIVLFIYWLLIQFLGYVIATLISSCGLFKIIGEYNLRKSFILAITLTIFLYLVFIFWLKMPFPTGFLNI